MISRRSVRRVRNENNPKIEEARAIAAQMIKSAPANTGTYQALALELFDDMTDAAGLNSFDADRLRRELGLS